MVLSARRRQTGRIAVLYHNGDAVASPQGAQMRVLDATLPFPHHRTG